MAEKYTKTFEDDSGNPVEEQLSLLGNNWRYSKVTQLPNKGIRGFFRPAIDADFLLFGATPPETVTVPIA